MEHIIPIAFAQESEVETSITAEVADEDHEGEGLSINPSVVAFQALNFLILIIVLHKILYKPMTQLLQTREKRIKDGVENAERADQMLKESQTIRHEMIQTARTDSQEILEKARKSGEELKAGIVDEAHGEAQKIVKIGHGAVEMEKAKTAEELKTLAVDMVVAATEKMLRKKVDAKEDMDLIKESLKSYSV